MNNTFYDNNYDYIPLEHLEEHLFSRNDKYYVKLDNSNQGRGVFIIQKEHFHIGKLLKMDNCVIQEPIIASDSFNEVTDSGGVTIRITTTRTDNNKIQIRAGTLRVGIEGSDIVKHYDSIRIPINILDGTLGSFGAESYWQKVSGE